MPDTDFNVEYIAHLARFELSEDEKKTLGGQLRSILGYVQKIAELDVSGIEPTLHGFPVNNVFRKDEPTPSLDREVVLNNAPQRIGDEFKMPKVVE